jgi:hypothetical protein
MADSINAGRTYVQPAPIEVPHLGFQPVVIPSPQTYHIGPPIGGVNVTGY